MNRKRLLSLIVVAIAGIAGVARAQQVVFDPSNTLQNALTAAVKDHIVSLLGDQLDQLQQIARRLSVFTDLRKYAGHDTPEWRIHLFQFEQYFFANRFNASLNYGDGAGAGFDEVARARVTPDEEWASLAGEIGRAHV